MHQLILCPNTCLCDDYSIRVDLLRSLNLIILPLFFPIFSRLNYLLFLCTYRTFFGILLVVHTIVFICFCFSYFIFVIIYPLSFSKIKTRFTHDQHSERNKSIKYAYIYIYIHTT